MYRKYEVLKLSRVILLALLGLFTVRSAGAVNMTFTGTLVSAPRCTMTLSDIAIDFGPVDVNRVQAGNDSFDKWEVQYNPSCTNTQNSSNYTVSLTFGGVPAVGSTQALSTTNKSVGVVMVDSANKVLTINQAVNVNNLADWPKLYVRLAKLSALVEGSFSASGTLIIAVQ